ncbi:HipA domain-containing protein [Alteromonas facilis]|uniref:HipA domain-containing protein n=1 Tax=Alteromonas facilis TaxID=2048004 RepID=UPI000C284C83|nr:HipA domain-containing protein [Alteromonas facilis]
MTGSNSLDVFIGTRLNKIATLTLESATESEMSLVYEPGWVKEGFAFSPHLPLDGKFDSRAVRNFIQNLLPEGRGLEEITSNTTVSKNNAFGLIRVIGADTSGAISFRPFKSPPVETSFRAVSKEELSDRLKKFKSSAASLSQWDGTTRLSVAGVQDKLNFLERNGELGFGEGNLCSNRIFKFETGKVPFIAVNEFFTMALAKEAGLEIPHIELRDYGGVRTFVIDRFDRQWTPDKDVVLRRHVIDGCQAINLPPSYKYERQHGDSGDGAFIRDGASFPKLFGIKTSNQAAYKTSLIRWLIFNVLNRNYDAHGKNISFFINRAGMKLTPFYDLVNIEALLCEVEKQSGGNASEEAALRSYAMSIGEYEQGEKGNFTNPITAYALADFASSFAISPERLHLLITQLISKVELGIEKAKSLTLKYDLSDQESKHVELCVSIVQKAIEELKEESKQITEMFQLI